MRLSSSIDFSPFTYFVLPPQFANNVAKFTLSIGPQTTKDKGQVVIDLQDDAVQNMLISYNGEGRWPDKITPFQPPPPPKQAEEAEPLTAVSYTHLTLPTICSV